MAEKWITPIMVSISTIAILFTVYNYVQILNNNAIATKLQQQLDAAERRLRNQEAAITKSEGTMPPSSKRAASSNGGKTISHWTAAQVQEFVRTSLQDVASSNKPEAIGSVVEKFAEVDGKCLLDMYLDEAHNFSCSLSIFFFFFHFTLQAIDNKN